MQRHRGLLALGFGIFFAGAVFVFNALPSSVFVDDADSKLVPSATYHHGQLGDLDAPGTGILLLLTLVPMGAVLLLLAKLSSPALIKSPIARGPPLH